HRSAAENHHRFWLGNMTLKGAAVANGTARDSEPDAVAQTDLQTCWALAAGNGGIRQPAGM
ncbi:hypothetical protein LH464_22695, partial [Neorhizobium sp. T786]|uniref:hypothetical protein n=1 Tax=Pseudorhizobium xiangyangii TaxID=2883104 RepID=UPI001CFF5828